MRNRRNEKQIFDDILLFKEKNKFLKFISIDKTDYEYIEYYKWIIEKFENNESVRDSLVISDFFNFNIHLNKTTYKIIYKNEILGFISCLIDQDNGGNYNFLIYDFFYDKSSAFFSYNIIIDVINLFIEKNINNLKLQNIEIENIEIESLINDDPFKLILIGDSGFKYRFTYEKDVNNKGLSLMCNYNHHIFINDIYNDKLTEKNLKERSLKVRINRYYKKNQLKKEFKIDNFNNKKNITENRLKENVFKVDYYDFKKILNDDKKLIDEIIWENFEWFISNNNTISNINYNSNSEISEIFKNFFKFNTERFNLSNDFIIEKINFINDGENRCSIFDREVFIQIDYYENRNEYELDSFEQYKTYQKGNHINNTNELINFKKTIILKISNIEFKKNLFEKYFPKEKYVLNQHTFIKEKDFNNEFNIWEVNSFFYLKKENADDWLITSFHHDIKNILLEKGDSENSDSLIQMNNFLNSKIKDKVIKDLSSFYLDYKLGITKDQKFYLYKENQWNEIKSENWKEIIINYMFKEDEIGNNNFEKSDNMFIDLMNLDAIRSNNTKNKIKITDYEYNEHNYIFKSIKENNDKILHIILDFYSRLRSIDQNLLYSELKKFWDRELGIKDDGLNKFSSFVPLDFKMNENFFFNFFNYKYFWIRNIKYNILKIYKNHNNHRIAESSEKDKTNLIKKLLSDFFIIKKMLGSIQNDKYYNSKILRDAVEYLIINNDNGYVIDKSKKNNNAYIRNFRIINKEKIIFDDFDFKKNDFEDKFNTKLNFIYCLNSPNFDDNFVNNYSHYYQKISYVDNIDLIKEMKLFKKNINRKRLKNKKKKRVKQINGLKMFLNTLTSFLVPIWIGSIIDLAIQNQLGTKESFLIIFLLFGVIIILIIINIFTSKRYPSSWTIMKIRSNIKEIISKLSFSSKRNNNKKVWWRRKKLNKNKNNIKYSMVISDIDNNDTSLDSFIELFDSKLIYKDYPFNLIFLFKSHKNHNELKIKINDRLKLMHNYNYATSYQHEYVDDENKLENKLINLFRKKIFLSNNIFNDCIIFPVIKYDDDFEYLDLNASSNLTNSRIYFFFKIYHDKNKLENKLVDYYERIISRYLVYIKYNRYTWTFFWDKLIINNFSYYSHIE